MADCVTALCCRVFMLSSGPFGQIILSSISALTGTDYCSQGTQVFLWTKKAKLRQADHTVQVPRLLELFA